MFDKQYYIMLYCIILCYIMSEHSTAEGDAKSQHIMFSSIAEYVFKAKNEVNADMVLSSSRRKVRIT